MTQNRKDEGMTSAAVVECVHVYLDETCANDEKRDACLIERVHDLKLQADWLSDQLTDIRDALGLTEFEMEKTGVTEVDAIRDLMAKVKR